MLIFGNVSDVLLKAQQSDNHKKHNKFNNIKEATCP